MGTIQNKNSQEGKTDSHLNEMLKELRKAVESFINVPLDTITQKKDGLSNCLECLCEVEELIDVIEKEVKRLYKEKKKLKSLKEIQKTIKESGFYVTFMDLGRINIHVFGDNLYIDEKELKKSLGIK